MGSTTVRRGTAAQRRCEARDRGEPRRPQAGAGGRRASEEGLHRRGGQAHDAEPGGDIHDRAAGDEPDLFHDGKTVLPGPGNPVGTRWMGLSMQGYGIHGTNEPKSIGKAASHGCIRMAKADLEELYALVQVGDTVELVGSATRRRRSCLAMRRSQWCAGAQPTLRRRYAQ